MWSNMAVCLQYYRPVDNPHPRTSEVTFVTAALKPKSDHCR